MKVVKVADKIRGSVRYHLLLSSIEEKKKTGIECAHDCAAHDDLEVQGSIFEKMWQMTTPYQLQSLKLVSSC